MKNIDGFYFLEADSIEYFDIVSREKIIDQNASLRRLKECSSKSLNEWIKSDFLSIRSEGFSYWSDKQVINS